MVMALFLRVIKPMSFRISALVFGKYSLHRVYLLTTETIKYNPLALFFY